MADLSIDPDYIRSLVLKVRAIMAVEANDIPDEGSNPTDDDLPPDELQEDAGDLTREEFAEEIRGLSADQQAELVALMWLGREDDPAASWDELVAMAKDERERPTEDYLLRHPELAEYWLDGLEKLGLGGLLDDTVAEI